MLPWCHCTWSDGFKSDSIQLSIIASNDNVIVNVVNKWQHEINQQLPSLPQNAFLLVIQTNFKQQLYQQHAHKVLCVIATHVTNAYQFKLSKYIPWWQMMVIYKWIYNTLCAMLPMYIYFKMTFGIMAEKQPLTMSYTICYATGMLTGMYVHIRM